MSNHTGSYMLNEIISYLKNQGCFEHLSRDERYETLKKLLKYANIDDCNYGEILEGLCKYFEICKACTKRTTKLDEFEYCEECKE